MGGSEIEVEWAFYFIPNAYLFAVPATAGVGEIGDVVKINIQVRFPDDPQLPVIILFPDFPVIKLRPGTSMHANCFDGDEPSEIFQVVAEFGVG